MLLKSHLETKPDKKNQKTFEKCETAVCELKITAEKTNIS